MTLRDRIRKVNNDIVDKVICVKDVTDTDFIKYNSVSLFLAMLSLATFCATILTLVQRQFSFLPYIIALFLLSLVSGANVRKHRLSNNALNNIIHGLELVLTIIGPILYMFSGGLNSSTTIWYFLVLIFTIIILEGKEMWYFFFLQLFLYSAIIVLDYFEIVNIRGELSRGGWYLSAIVSLFAVSISIATYILFQIKEYKRVQVRLLSEIQEVTRKKEQAENIIAQYEEQKMIAEKAVRTQAEFLANINHEIKTPLNAIIGLSEVIDRIDDVNEIHMLTHNILSASRGLNCVISNILEYSATGDVEINLNPHPYDTEIIFNSFKNMCIPRLETKGLGFELKRDKIPPCLFGDLTRIQQVLFNIANNAIKYTETGKITLRTSYNYDRNELILGISDTGSGIKKEDISRIFDEFEYGEETSHKHKDGVGLGLSLSKKIVDVMGGNITVESELGKGSTFTVVIPQRISDETRIMSASAEMEKIDFRGKKILYVDSTQANHLIVDAILIKTGVYVGHEFSPKGILQMQDDKIRSFDIFIIDARFPAMDGVQLLSHIRGMGIKTPAICAVSDMSSTEIASLTSNGFDGILHKPIKPEELIPICSKVFYGKN